MQLGSTRSLLFALAFAACIAAPLTSQVVGGKLKVKYTVDAEVDRDRFGAAVCPIPDLDGDGVTDIVVSARLHDVGPLHGAGRVYALSGANGTELFHIDGTASGEWFGEKVANAGDVNGDGKCDILVSAHVASRNGLEDNGAAYVYSGLDGSQIYEFEGQHDFDRLGFGLSGFYDFDDDGFDDFLVGAHKENIGAFNNAGAVYLISGATGAVLHKLSIHQSDAHFGESIASIADLDNDGAPEILVGAPWQSHFNAGQDGSVYVFSGATLQQIARIDAATPVEHFGEQVCDAGDVDGDGLHDILVGAPLAERGGLRWQGSALIYSGRNGQLLQEWRGEHNNAFLAEYVAPAGDLDRDGHADVLVASIRPPAPEPPRVYAFSGRTGAVIAQLDSDENDDFGKGLAGLGDIDGDGLSEFVVTRTYPDLNPDFGGQLLTFGWTPYLNASTGSLSIATGGRVDYEIDFSTAHAGDPYRLLMSAAGTGPTIVGGLEVPLSADGLFARTLSGNYPYPSALTGFSGLLDASGRATALLDVAPGSIPPSLSGMTLYFAAIVRPVNAPPAKSSVWRSLVIEP